MGMPEEKQLYNLEQRTLFFAQKIRAYVRRLPFVIGLAEDIRQLVRSSGSVAANYIEANEALSRKDFVMRIKICRKEAKESILWIHLLKLDEQFEQERKDLLQEAKELVLIFAAILRKVRAI